MARKKIIVIAGPTASGKSALALAIAQETGAVIINADSMQVYSEIPVLSAQPSTHDKATVPHHLYGFLPGNAHCSAGRWLERARQEIDTARAAGRQVLVVGGTGLYIKSLMDGLSPIPDIEPEIRAKVRERFLTLGNAAFHAQLAERDPLMASLLPMGDSQRLMRSMEVLEQTGISLKSWQQIPPVRCYPPEDFTALLLLPPRPLLYAQCNSRFEAMLQAGAVEEVEALRDAEIPATFPVMKALGVPELAAYIRDEITREDAIARATQSTRRYAKRQCTWFRHQMPEAKAFAYQGREDDRQAALRYVVEVG